MHSLANEIDPTTAICDVITRADDATTSVRSLVPSLEERVAEVRQHGLFSRWWEWKCGWCGFCQ